MARDKDFLRKMSSKVGFKQHFPLVPDKQFVVIIVVLLNTNL